MLKVTMHAEPTVNRLVVAGRLLQAATAELAGVWLQARMAEPGKAMEAELSDVTHVDRSAMDLLSTMHQQGVRLTGAGAMTRALIAEASGHWEQTGAAPCA